jgi:hypothetical protein
LFTDTRLSSSAILALLKCNGLRSAGDRYEVRQGEQPGEWKVWDTRTDAAVFGAESMTESAATELARRLNEAWRQWRGA